MRKTFALVVLGLALSATTASAYPPDGGIGLRTDLYEGSLSGTAPPTPADFGGNKCQGVTKGAPNVWYGRFAGGRSIGASFGDDRRINTHTSEGCFKSRNACEAWMLALKTKYSRKPIYNYCQAGYDPGSDIPPWWAPRS